MSYDLMVFEPGAAPSNHLAFLEYYSRLIKWDEGHSYGDLAITSHHLRAWLADMIPLFPAMNEELALAELPEDEATASDYSIGKQFVYVCFAWSKAEAAYRTVFDLAGKHRLGLFNVSSPDGEVWLPESDGLVLAHRKEPPTLRGRLRRLLKIGAG